MKNILFILLFFPLLVVSQQSFNFLHDGLNREYIFYSPNNLPLNAPLVFVAHGFNESPSYVMGYSGMNAVADQNGFAICYPKGTADNLGRMFWNVGFDFHSNVTVDDVSFLESLAIHLQSTYQLSSSNTFFTGFSNGGGMANIIAFDGSNVFKAFAPVSGTVFPNGTINNLFNANNSVPFLITHALNDNVILYEGDINDQYWGPYLGVDTLVNFWVNSNSLNNVIVDTFPDINNDGKITISKKYYSSLNNIQVWLYTHEDDHNWILSDIIIEQKIWDFFSLFINNSTELTERNNNKKLSSVFNLLGQKKISTKNNLLLYQYDDGSVEKKLLIK